MYVLDWPWTSKVSPAGSICKTCCSWPHSTNVLLLQVRQAWRRDNAAGFQRWLRVRDGLARQSVRMWSQAVTLSPAFLAKQSTEFLGLRWATSGCRTGPTHIAELMRAGN